MNSTNKSASNRAIAALNSLLSQVSAIRLKDIGVGPDIDGEIDILAYVEIFGRNHTIACQMSSGRDADEARTALQELRGRITQLPGDVTPMLILPVLSPEVQSFCSQNQAGCLDLRGNGRLSVGEVFVSMRSLPRQAFHRPASQIRTAAGEGSVAQAGALGFPAASARLPQHSIQAAGRAHPL